ncbi:hypothetical protein K438DRAFT_1799929 [Mycena galopus ATCC 62051]|nr:hypothetical protein K438DRAFT_1799929 [Mycena galopus ATCC 62051]
MSFPPIHQRLLDIRAEFLRVFSVDNHEEAAALSLKWTQLDTDLKAESLAGLLDDETVAMAHTVASEISILSDSLTKESASTHDIASELTKDVEDIFANLNLNDTTSEDSPSIPPASRSDPSLPPYIEPAYKWLLKHLHNPYPKKEVKEKIADETGSSLERISDWFVDVRRRMGWTALLREEYGRKRKDLIDAATRYYVHPNHKYPLPVDIQGRFAQMEAFAQDMYAAKLVPSALSNKLTAAVKELTPERQEKARLERMWKVQTQREAAKLGVYPSPPASGPSSPISDPGASTSRKRSYSESSDTDDDSLSKRSRTDDGAFTLPSPPYSTHSSPGPSSRKRRLSDAGAPSSSKRPRIVAPAPPPTPSDMAAVDNAGIFAPGQLLDIRLFNPAEYEFASDEPVQAQPVVQTTATMLPPASTLELDTVNIELPADTELPAELEYWLNLVSDDFSQPPAPISMYPTPAVYDEDLSLSFTDPFAGTYDSEYITPSFADSFGFEPLGFENSQLQPQVYSAFPDGKVAGELIAGLLGQPPQHQQPQQQHKIQNEYPLYQQPISC